MNVFKKVLSIVITLGFIISPANVGAQESTIEPIVLVPGIMGSWNWDKMLQRSGAGDWDFFPIDHTWENMISALENAGYEKDKTLFVAFYDWRQHNSNSVIDYLMPTIDKALVNSPTGKVNLIAHSMGGLVARSYLQGSRYRNDVNELIMLGTPNYGSSDVYTLWEGGMIPKNWDNVQKSIISSYLWYMTTATTQTADNYETIHTFIPSIQEMLPVYNFLKDSEGNFKNYSGLVEAKNPFLENLDDFWPAENLHNIGHVTVIVGKGEGTVGTIPVVERDAEETKLWVDGLPNPLPPERNNTEGDNRVLLASAYLNKWSVAPPVFTQSGWRKFFANIFRTAHAAFEGNINTFLLQKEIVSKHGDLPTMAINDVFDALTLPTPTVAYVPPLEPDNITSFWFASPVEVKVTDPQGRVITKNTNNIPEAIYTGESDPNGVKMVIIPNGLSGQYKIELLGTGDGSYHMAAATFTDGNDNIVTVEKSIVVGEKIEYTANIDANATVPPTISEPVITPPESEEPPVEKSAIELLKELIADVETYYQGGQIKNKGIYQSLLNDLKIALAALEEAELTRPIGEKYPKLHELKVKIAQKLAIAKLESFESRVETQSSKGKIDSVSASDMESQAEAIIDKI